MKPCLDEMEHKLILLPTVYVYIYIYIYTQ